MSAARVSIEQVREAVVRRRGNMSAAAEDLGIARNNLYKRIVKAGVDIEAIRAGRAGGKRITRVMRVPEDLFTRLREAKFDLQHKLRREMAEGDVLAAFVEEGFEAWLAAKLSS